MKTLNEEKIIISIGIYSFLEFLCLLINQFDCFNQLYQDFNYYFQPKFQSHYFKKYYLVFLQ
jgi:hypothetical protein